LVDDFVNFQAPKKQTLRKIQRFGEKING